MEAILTPKPPSLEVEPGSLGYVPDSHGRSGDCHTWLRENEDLSDVAWEFRNLYGYAVPSHQAMNAIHAFSPNGVLELGAGLGYWAHVMRYSGIDTLAVDIHDARNNPYFPYSQFGTHNEPRAWTSMETTITPEELTNTNKALMLCWPDVDSFASKSLSLYGGDHFIYVGEGQGMATGDDKFHDALRSRWVETNRIDIPRLPHRCDALRLFKRRIFR